MNVTQVDCNFAFVPWLESILKSDFNPAASSFPEQLAEQA
jgi:hypothetical protein